MESARELGWSGTAFFACLLLLLSSLSLSAQGIRTERVSFAAGTSGAVLKGRLTGDEVVDFVIGALNGQRMTVVMTPDNPSAYFNILPSGNPEAIHIGSVAGNRFDGVLPSSGDWLIRVYLIRAAARRGERSDYTLSIHIGGAGDAVSGPDFADGDAGGPDFWEVTGVPAGDSLNIRTGPSTNHDVIARASNGQIFRNLGCGRQGGSRWCHVQTADGRYDGWVSGRYLREGSGPAASGAGVLVPSGSQSAPDLFVRPTGEIEARWTGGCTVLYNPAGGRIQAGSSCTGGQLNASDRTVERYRN